MHPVDAVKKMLSRTISSFPLLKVNPFYNPTMNQRPIIDAGNTGRYAPDGFQVAFNSIAGGGTLAPNAPNPAGTFIDVTLQQKVQLTGFGTIPQTLGTQGLVEGFRDRSL